MYRQKQTVLIWYYPGRGSFHSSLDRNKPTDPPNVTVGTILRNFDMLGVALPYQYEYKNVPLAKHSIPVKCLYSISPFSRLDKSEPHIWNLKTCQILNGNLKEYAIRDPRKFLTKLIEIENNGIEA